MKMQIFNFYYLPPLPSILFSLSCISHSTDTLFSHIHSLHHLCTTLQSELHELRRSHEELVTATSRERADHEASMSELRSRIKIKAFEHGRLNLLVEEQRDGLNVAKKEANKKTQR
jgi:hypothetical protein